MDGITSSQIFVVKLNIRYRVHFWAKADGTVAGFRYKLIPHNPPRVGFEGPTITNPIEAGTSWTEETSEIDIQNPNDKTASTWAYSFQFLFTGQTTFYIDDLDIQEESD